MSERRVTLDDGSVIVWNARGQIVRVERGYPRALSHIYAALPFDFWLAIALAPRRCVNCLWPVACGNDGCVRGGVAG